MRNPQSDIFVEGSSHHRFLEYRINPSASVAAVVRALRVPFQQQEPGDHCVVGLGPRWSRQLLAVPPPADLREFEAIAGVRSAPSTQGDLWFWIHGTSTGRNLDRALAIHAALSEAAQLSLEVAGFIRDEKRDLTGFVDGSANPSGEKARRAALIASGPNAGGSLAMTQRWVHDLPAFGRLPVADQERVIGRTKEESIELEGDAMPPDSHVSRTDVKLDGVAQKIYRRSTPYGGVDEHGLYFVAFACELQRFQIQLDRMYGVSGDGVHDRLITFSEAVSGSYWYIPSEAQLAGLGSD